MEEFSDFVSFLGNSLYTGGREGRKGRDFPLPPPAEA